MTDKPAVKCPYCGRLITTYEIKDEMIYCECKCRIFWTELKNVEISDENKS